MHFPITEGIIARRRIGEVKAVDGVNLDDPAAARRYDLVGESGCGKTTMGRCLRRLETPTEGAIIYDGVDIAKLNRRSLVALRRRIQVIFQDPYSSLNPRQKVGSILAEPMRVHGLQPDAKKREARVRELLRTCGLNPNFADRYPHEMSGGQRQRVGIARALAVDPEFIVCDEAVSALDVSIQAQIINLLEDLREKFILTYLFIAHDLSVVRHLCQRVAVMYLRPCRRARRAATRSSTTRSTTLQGRCWRRCRSPTPTRSRPTAPSRAPLRQARCRARSTRPPGCVFHPRCRSRSTSCRQVIPEAARAAAGSLGCL